jgi:hypothetical protein
MVANLFIHARSATQETQNFSTPVTLSRLSTPNCRIWEWGRGD